MENNERISFDDLLLLICELVSMRSTCKKYKVGCVLVRDGRIISIGYNGMLSGFNHCESILTCQRASIPSGTMYEVGNCQHAEQNAILYCAKDGIQVDGSTIYVNSAVCRLCAKAIIAAGIIKVVYFDSVYDGIELLNEAGIECIKYDRHQLDDTVNKFFDFYSHRKKA